MGLFASKPTENEGNDSPRKGEVHVHVHMHTNSQVNQEELISPTDDCKKRMNELLLELGDREFRIRSTVHQQLNGLHLFHDTLEHHLGDMENTVNALKEQMKMAFSATTDSNEGPKAAESVAVAEVRPFFESAMGRVGNQLLEPMREETAIPSNRRFGIRLVSNGYQHTDDESDSDGIYTPDPE